MSVRPEVTITLGGSGQVVKRTGSSADSHDHVPLYGGKRPVGDRLGSSMDETYPYESDSRSKRQRRDDDHQSWAGDRKRSTSNRFVSQNDLRHKLTTKRLARWSTTNHEQRYPIDLREKLSRNPQTSPRSERQNISTLKTSSRMWGISPAKSADDLLRLDSRRRSYYASTSDGLTQRSPDQLKCSSRGTAQQNYDPPRHKLSVRSVEFSRPTSHTSRSVVDDSRKLPPTISKASVQSEMPRSVGHVLSSTGVVQKSSHTSEESHTVASLLLSLGLNKYAIMFQAEEIDMAALKQMGDNDLKELGIPMGPRKKILLALQSSPEQRT